MLRNEEPRRQRGVHRSSARRPHSQERQRRQGQHLLLCHVSFAPASHQHLRRATLPTRGGPSFLYRHYTNIYPRPFSSYIGRFSSFLISPERTSYKDIDYGLCSPSAAGVWSAAFLLLFHSSLLHSILTDGYTSCCESDGRWLVLGPISEGSGRLGSCG
jgi:hypothetical protein